MDGLIAQLKASRRAVADVFANLAILRIELAWLAVTLAEYGLVVSLNVFVFRRGGAGAVGVLGVLLFVPPAVASPIWAALADRYGRKPVMTSALTARTILALALAAVMIADQPLGLVFVTAAATMTMTTAFWALHLAMIPSLARSPEELTAANAVSSLAETIGSLAGPLMAAVVLAATSPGWAVVSVGAVLAVATLLVAGIKPPSDAVGEEEGEAEEDEGSFVAQITGGLRFVAGDRDVRTTLLLNGLQNVAQGAAGVLAVVVALSLFHGSASSAGLLSSTIGVGAVLGGLGGFLLIGRKSLATPLGATMVASGAAFLMLAGVPTYAVAMVTFAVVGAALPLCDVCTATIAQRLTPDRFLGRVFGVQDSLIWTGWAVGSALAGSLASRLGERGALVCLGALMPAYAVLRFARLRRMDGAMEVPEGEIDLLRRVPLFAPLSAQILEALAGRLARLRVGAGDVIIREGDPGDLYYVISSGTFEVMIGSAVVRTIGEGEGFGEIALLRNVPRTATVSAVTDGVLCSLEREPFLEAVTERTRRP
jgi:MFS family permease